MASKEGRMFARFDLISMLYMEFDSCFTCTCSGGKCAGRAGVALDRSWAEMACRARQFLRKLRLVTKVALLAG
jgi:hypothetical protein